MPMMLPLLNCEHSTKSTIVDETPVIKTRVQHRINFVTKRRKMSRRANLIGICGVSSICILLLIATAQHRPLPESLVTSTGTLGSLDNSGNSGGVGSSNSFGHSGSLISMARNALLLMSTLNINATIVDVLTSQGDKIANEMENFEYPSGRFGVDAEKLSEMTPATNGTPIRSIIVTTWRSGSTFLGDILNAMPSNYYHYEPLLEFGIKRVRDSEDSVIAVKNLKNLLNCEYIDMEEYLDYGKAHTYLFEHNERLWTVCKEYPQLCWRAKFLSPFCKLFPMQSMKTVRLRLELAEDLLKDKGLNVRIVLLVRDPRGTIQSRKHRSWCAGNPDCDNPKNLCQDMVDDYKSAVDFLNKYSSRFRTLRYEDLSVNPYDVTQDILQFYGLPFDPMVEEFLDTHTKENIGGVSSTYRDSKSAPFHWKQDLKIEEIQHIQEHCTKAMELWGYRKIENFTDYQRTFDPIIMPSPLAV